MGNVDIGQFTEKVTKASPITKLIERTTVDITVSQFLCEIHLTTFSEGLKQRHKIPDCFKIFDSGFRRNFTVVHKYVHVVSVIKQGMIVGDGSNNKLPVF